MESPSAENALVTRVCSRCSVQSQALGDFCPNCGKPYAGRRKLSRRVVASIVTVVLLVGLAVGGLLWKSHRDEVRADERAAAVAEQKVEKEAAAREQAEEEAQEAIETQAAADRAERKARASLVRFLQRTITKDARKDVAEGLLDGPILETSCTATGGGSTDDLTALTGTFECLAVTKEESDGTRSGYGYAGTIEWKSGSVTWQLGG